MNTFRITKQIDDNHFEIEVDWNRLKYCTEIDFRIEHDYVGILMDNFVPTKDISLELKGQPISNGLSLASYVQIPIRDFVSFCLPMIKESENCTKKHIKNNYKYGQTVIYYYEPKEKCHKVAIRLQNEEVYTHVTCTFFNKFVRPNLEKTTADELLHNS